MEERKDICEGYERDSVQQLDKLAKDKNERFPIYPLTYIQAVYDARTKERLDSILWKCNNVYLPWMGSAGDTRIQLPFWMRRKGIIITYKNLEDETITEKLTYDLCIADDFFRLDSSWTRITDALPVGGNITIGSNGNWFQDGVDTGFKAQGPKGDNGLTPMLRTVNNKLRYSYDGEVWYEISEYIAAWFRFQDNKIQISRDQKTWSDLSKPFTQDLYIKGYVATSSALPSTGVKQGDIYMVGPTYAAEDTEHKNPIYRMYVYNDSGWVDNGVFQSIAAGVVQTIGNSETEVMSQKAVSSIVGLDTYPVFSDTKPYVKGEIVNYGGLLYEFTADHEAGAWIGTDARETSLRKEIDRSIFTTSISINYSGIYIDRYGKFIRGIVGYNNIGVSNFIQIPSSRVDIQNIRVIETNHLGENTYIVAHLYDSRFNFLGYLTRSYSVFKAEVSISFDKSEAVAVNPNAFYFVVHLTPGRNVNIITDDDIVIASQAHRIEPLFNSQYFYNQFGGDYIVPGNYIQHFTNSNNGVTKFIQLVDKAKIGGIRASSICCVYDKNGIASYVYAMIYDVSFKFLGWLSTDSVTERLDLDIDLTKIRESFPGARFMLANVNRDSGFYVTGGYNCETSFFDIHAYKAITIDDVDDSNKGKCINKGNYEVEASDSCFISPYYKILGYNEIANVFFYYYNNNSEDDTNSSIFLYDRQCNFLGFIKFERDGFSNSEANIKWNIHFSKQDAKNIHEDAYYYRFNASSISNPCVIGNTPSWDADKISKTYRMSFNSSIAINCSNNYIDLQGKIIEGLRGYKYRGYSKFIEIDDNITIKGYSIVGNNKVSDTSFATVFLYDSNFNYVGYLTDDAKEGRDTDTERTIFLEECLSVSAAAKYFRVNTCADVDFILDAPTTVSVIDSQEIIENKVYPLITEGKEGIEIGNVAGQIRVPSIKNRNKSEVLNLLFIGSSFLVNTWWYLNYLLKEAGINANICCFYQGGAPFSSWLNAYDSNASIECYNSSNGSDFSRKDKPFKDTLESGDWDLITIQNGAVSSRDWNSFSSTWSKMVSIIRRNSKPTTLIAFNCAWVPPIDGDLRPYENTREGQKMFQQDIYDNYKRFSVLSGIPYCVPTGATVWAMRNNSSLEDSDDLSPDNLHLKNGLPIYATASTWFETFIPEMYNVSINDIDWLPTEDTPKNIINTTGFVPISTDQKKLIVEIVKLSASDRYGFSVL